MPKLILDYIIDYFINIRRIIMYFYFLYCFLILYEIAKFFSVRNLSFVKQKKPLQKSKHTLFLLKKCKSLLNKLMVGNVMCSNLGLKRLYLNITAAMSDVRH